VSAVVHAYFALMVAESARWAANDFTGFNLEIWLVAAVAAVAGADAMTSSSRPQRRTMTR
jgi:hypothetical protein